MCNILDLPICTLKNKSVAVEAMFEAVDLYVYDENIKLADFLEGISEMQFIDFGTSKKEFIKEIEDVANEENNMELNVKIEKITLYGGKDKLGEKENWELTFTSGEIICIVGKTGAGKSQLLEDIEYLSQGDTPSCRTIMINGKVLGDGEREYFENKLCSRLSQNMNFIMDLSVYEFVYLHAKCRLEKVSDKILKDTVENVIKTANELSGEKFGLSTPVTRLSGGQSRALMIADIALLSNSDIILIDELENAGVNREKALKLLSKQGKIILISTHDPILALAGDKRVVIKNGGISEVIESNKEERNVLEKLKEYDRYMLYIREKIRNGCIVKEAYSFD